MSVTWLYTLAFAGKLIFILLIYGVLLIIFLHIREELKGHVPVSERQRQRRALGKIEFIRTGNAQDAYPGKVLPLEVPELRIGWEDSNHLILKDSTVSGQHAILSWDGMWRIQDLGSRNGTFVNNTQCPAHQRRNILPGDTIGIGQNISFRLLELER